MVKQAHLFLQLVRIVLETAFLHNVLPFYSLDIIEELFIASKHLGRIVEVDPNHIIGQRVADAVLGRVINPLSDSGSCTIQLWFAWSLFIVASATILQDPLTLSPSNILLHFFFSRLINGAGPISRQESILTFLAEISTSSLHENKLTNSLLV